LAYGTFRQERLNPARTFAKENRVAKLTIETKEQNEFKLE
jgi:hypothetical protein